MKTCSCTHISSGLREPPYVFSELALMLCHSLEPRHLLLLLLESCMFEWRTCRKPTKTSFFHARSRTTNIDDVETKETMTNQQLKRRQFTVSLACLHGVHLRRWQSHPLIDFSNFCHFLSFVWGFRGLQVPGLSFQTNKRACCLQQILELWDVREPQGEKDGITTRGVSIKVEESKRA
eukprot:2119882-Amphidinium_carterae.2